LQKTSITLQRPLLRRYFFKEDRICFKYKDKTIVSIIQNDWLKRKTKFMMLILIPLLPKEIVIVGSYFLPGRRMNTALKKAAKNKVKIKLILPAFQTLHSPDAQPIIFTLLFWTITLSYMNGTKPFCMEKQQLLTAIGPLSVQQII
jgi:hypothetical protein